MLIRRIAILVLTTASLGLTPWVAATAQEADSPSTQVETAENQPTEAKFSRRVKKQIGQAHAMFAKGDYDKGLQRIDALLEYKELGPPEQALLYILKGSTYFEFADDENAIIAFQQAYDTGGLSLSDGRDTLMDIAKLSFAADKYEQAAAALEQWKTDGGANDITATELLIDSWSHARQFDKALIAAEPYFEAISDKERRHYDLMNFLYMKNGRIADQARILRDMISIWPDDNVLRDSLAALKTP